MRTYFRVANVAGWLYARCAEGHILVPFSVGITHLDISCFMAVLIGGSSILVLVGFCNATFIASETSIFSLFVWFC